MTLSQTGMSESSKWEVLVVGAGPAGTMAARTLARAGKRVLLIDRAHFPRAKVCGSCLSARAVHLLTHQGLGHVLEDAVPTRTASLRFGRLHAELSTRGVVLSRESLDWLLVQAAIREGVTFRDSCNATISPPGPDGLRAVTLRPNGSAPRVMAFGAVVQATGLPGRRETAVSPNSRIGAGTVLEGHPSVPAGVIQMHIGVDGYVGLVRLEDGRIDAAAALAPGAPRCISTAVARILSEAGHPLAEEARQSTWRGTPLLAGTAAQLAEPRLFLIGDAASYVEPFTGEGITWALEAGLAVAPYVVRALDGSVAEAEASWERNYRFMLTRRQRVCRMVSAIVRHPMALRFAIGAIAMAPALAFPIIRQVHGARLAAMP